MFITSSYGLGEAVVQGAVNPDEFYVYKPALRAGRPAILKRGIGGKATKMVYTADRTVGKTTEFVDVDRGRPRLAVAYRRRGRPSWPGRRWSSRTTTAGRWTSSGARTALDGQLYILQARPETVQSRAPGRVGAALPAQPTGARCWSRAGRSGRRSAPARSGCCRRSTDMHEFVPGEVLVADMTDPDWEPIMKRASAIVTNRGGRTCHAAIIARELGIPAVVGTGSATRELADGGRSPSPAPRATPASSTTASSTSPSSRPSWTPCPTSRSRS